MILKSGWIFLVMGWCLACQSKPGSGKDAHLKPDSGRRAPGVSKAAVYKPGFNPTPGTKYAYSINNESETEIETGGKTLVSINRSDCDFSYAVARDKTGNFLLTMHYDKLKVYTKNGDRESVLDAANAANSIDPMEKMLAIVKDATIVASVNSQGVVTNLGGYKELGDRIMANINAGDVNTRVMAQQQWEKTIGEGLVRKSMDQLVGLLPDSPIRVGQSWKTTSTQKDDIPFKVNTQYTLTDIEDGVALIASESEMTSDNADNTIMGTHVSGQLSGSQKGKHEVEISTGMLISNKVSGKVEGTLQVMGRDVPVTIENSLKMTRRKG